MKSFNPSPHLQRRWLWGGAALTAVLVFLTVLASNAPSFDLWSGVIVTAVFTISLSYAARKRLFLSSLGTLRAWMASHLVLGSLVLVTMVLHGGVSTVGTQGLLLYAFALAEFVSGLWGVYELKATPRRYAELKDIEIVHPSAARTRIAQLSTSLARDLERRKPEFQEWFRERFGAVVDERSDQIPTLEGGPKGSDRHGKKLYALLEQIVDMRGVRNKLELVEARSRRWLFLHVPAAVGFLSLVVLHVVSRLLY